MSLFSLETIFVELTADFGIAREFVSVDRLLFKCYEEKWNLFLNIFQCAVRKQREKRFEENKNKESLLPILEIAFAKQTKARKTRADQIFWITFNKFLRWNFNPKIIEKIFRKVRKSLSFYIHTLRNKICECLRNKLALLTYMRRHNE